jgi:hypothetical protein
LDGSDERSSRHGGATGAGTLAPDDDDDDDDARGANDEGTRRAVRSRLCSRDASLPHLRWDTARSPSDAANAAAVIDGLCIGPVVGWVGVPSF